jgi:hypothetical protein
VIPGYGISVLAGTGTSGSTGNGGLATAATLTTPYQAIYDSSGNLFIADYGANVIRMVSASTGLISTVVGGGTATTVGGACPTGTGTATDLYGDGCIATAAVLSAPRSIAFDPSGNLYIVDVSHYLVRKVTNPSTGTGTITVFGGELVAGVGTEGCPSGGGGGTYTSDVFLGSTIGPVGIVFDTNGIAYVSMSSTHCKEVMKVSTTGIVTLFAGDNSSAAAISGGPMGYVSGSTVAASDTAASYFVNSYALAIDKNNTIYIASTSYNTIIKVPTTGPGAGIITTVAGLLNTTAAADSGDGGLATAASLDVPSGIAVDPSGNIFIATSTGNHIREILASNGLIYTVAGGGTALANGGSALATTLSAPQYLTSDSFGNIYIPDSGNHELRKLSAFPFTSSTAVGSTTAKTEYVIMAETAALKSLGIQSTATTPDYTLGTISGCTVNGTTTNTLGTACTLPITFKPVAPGERLEPIVAVDAANNVSSLQLSGVGTGSIAGLLPGTISSVTSTVGVLKTPAGPSATDADGDVFIADTGNNVVRKITPAGVISVIAGTAGTAGYSGDGAAATAATLKAPAGVAADGFGNVYIADTGNNVIRLVNANGIISTFAGTGTAGSSGTGVAPTTATLNGPTGLAVDITGNVYIADTNNNEIREVSSLNGLITTLAGSTSSGFGGDGTVSTGITVALNTPGGLAVDTSSNLYIADTGNQVIRKITASTGIITSVAGMGTKGGYSGDGSTATAAQLSAPTAIALDAASDLFITDTGNNAIRRVSNGIITTIAGTPGIGGYAGDAGAATSAVLQAPTGVGVDGVGNLYILDAGNNVLRKVSLTTTPAGNFPDTIATNTSAVITKTLTNLGNVTLNLSGVAVTAPFTQQNTNSTTSLDCASTTSTTATSTVAAGSSCNVGLLFTPPAVANYTGTLTLTDDAANTAGSTQVENLTGKGVIALGTLSVSTPTVVYPAASVASITVAGSGTHGTPTGTVTYYLDGAATGTTATLVSGAYNANLGSLGSGTHTFTVTYSGDTTYGSSTITTTFTVTGMTVTLNTTLAPAAPTYGTAITATAVMTVTTGTPVTGTVTYNLDAGVTKSVSVTNGTVSFTLGTPAVGSHSLVVTYTGNTQNASATQTINFTVGTAATTTVVSTSSASIYYGAGITLTATVSDAIGITPTGTVQFMDGSTLICTGTLAAGTTSVLVSPTSASSCTTTAMSIGVHSITAVYSGSTNFTASTSGVLAQTMIAPDFAVTTQSAPTTTTPTPVTITSLTVQSGQTSAFQVTIQGNNNIITGVSGTTNTYDPTYAYAGTVNMSCSGLPSFMSCTFSPASIPLTNGTTSAKANTYCTAAAQNATTLHYTCTTAAVFPIAQVTIQTASQYQSMNRPGRGGLLAAGLLLPACLIGLAGLKRRKLSVALRSGLMLGLALVALVGANCLTGCGYNIAGTNPGTYNINVVGTDSANNIVETTPLSVTVTQ